MNQVLLGLSIPYIVSAIIYASHGFRASLRMLIVTPITMTAFAIWAIAPDIPRLLRMDGLYDRLYRDPRCDIFFWHYTIDKSETYSPWFAAGFILVLVSIIYAAWRELRIAEKE